MRARLVQTQGPWLEAVIECQGQTLHVMDGFSLAIETAPHPGEEFEIELGGTASDEESWERIFSGNPDQRVALEHRAGWSYKAYGKVVGVAPVRVDCGVLEMQDVVRTSDERVIGEYVAFRIERLEAQGWRTGGEATE